MPAWWQTYACYAGLAKKVLIANHLGFVADRVFSLPAHESSVPLAWLGLVCYTFHVYYDFSGYSDMAIGLGRFFGFHFPENFNQPYRAQSVTEFWRRWHITLSRWFRDFLWFPLGQSVPGVEVAGVTSLVLIIYSAIVLSTVGFNPFIYFRF